MDKPTKRAAYRARNRWTKANLKLVTVRDLRRFVRVSLTEGFQFCPLSLSLVQAAALLIEYQEKRFTDDQQGEG